MFSQYAGYISGILITLSFVPYLFGIFQGKVKPERASWFIWAVLGGISFFSQVAKGATHSLWLPAAQALGDIVVFFFSFRYGMGGFQKRDKIALAASAFSLLLWYLTNEAAYTLIFAIIIDTSGSVLTIIKSYEHPSTEPMSAWVLTVLGGLFAIFAVGAWNPILLIFPFYIFVINLGIISSIVLGKKLAPRT